MSKCCELNRTRTLGRSTLSFDMDTSVLASLSFWSAHVSVDSTAAVLACRAGANSVRYTTAIANCISLRSSPVLSLALCVGSSDQCGGSHCCTVFDGSACVYGEVLCHVVVVCVWFVVSKVL